MSKNKLNDNNVMKKSESFLEKWILPIMSVAVVSIFPVLFLYFQNADEADFSEVVSPLLIFATFAAIIFITFLLLTKHSPKAAIITSVFILVTLNYALLERIAQAVIPALRYWHILPIFLFVLIHLAWIIYKKLKNDLANIITPVICIVFSGLILFNGVIAAPTIINKISIEKNVKEQNAKTTQMAEGETNLPNIYYLIFDEYSSVDFMKKYYDYDNSAATEHLGKIGFNVSYSSHNECISTSAILSNLVNMNYNVKYTTPESEKKNYKINNELFNFLKKKGYSITGVGNAEIFGLENASTKISKSKTSTVGGETISDLLFKKTLVWPFYGVNYNKSQEIIISAFKYLKAPKNFQKNGSFIICHVDCPHEPFYFDKNGHVYAKPNSNWKDPKYYLGQYIFTTTQMLEIADSIVKNDPNSIIIVQSDHSARASSDSELFMELFSLKDMSNIFNAVYLKGDKFDIEGLPGVNTLRLLLNKAFGENFEMLDMPADTNKYK